MMPVDRVYAQAAALAGELEEQQLELLKLLCQTATVNLENRLRDGVTEADCRGEFVTAASFCALAALHELGSAGELEEFKAGDLTVKRTGADTVAQCLRRQAELVMEPYVKNPFIFMGV